VLFNSVKQRGLHQISIKQAIADVGLLLTAFNLRRLMNIIDKKAFFSYLKKLTLFLIFLKMHFKLHCRLIF